jgi:hypothetical protein
MSALLTDKVVVDAAFTSAVSQFATNPAISGKTLRELLNANPDKFFRNSIPLLKRLEEEPGSTYVQVLLLSRGLLLSDLLSDETFSSEELAAIARKLSKVDPLFVVKSLESVLPDSHETAATDPSSVSLRLRLMDVLQSVQEGHRILPVMKRLLQDPDPKVRSKAALLVGKTNQSARWVEDCLGAVDSRVRANAVESLWNVDSQGVRTLLWNVLTDPDNRSVGNALFGLYRLGDVDVLEQILLMAQDKRDLFRSTAAWVMGRTGDSRFHPTLVNMIRDKAPVRTTAFRALGLLKQSKTRLEQLPALTVGGWRNEAAQDQDEIMVTVGQTQHVPGLRPTEFILHREEALVIHYEVKEVTQTGALSMAFLLPCYEECASYAQALQAAATYRRKNDGWLIARYNTPPIQEKREQADYRTSGILNLGGPVPAAPPPIPAADAADLSFLSDSVEIEAAIQTAPDPLRVQTPLECLQAISRAAHSIRVPHLILFVPSNAETFAQEFLAEANRVASSLKACFHAVSVCASDIEPCILSLCQKTGGTYLRGSISQLPQLLSQLALGVAGSYRVRLAPGPGTFKLQVFSEQGWGGFDLN